MIIELLTSVMVLLYLQENLQKLSLLPIISLNLNHNLFNMGFGLIYYSAFSAAKAM